MSLFIKKFAIILTCIVLYSAKVMAEIIPVSHMAAAEKIIMQHTASQNKTLIAFDIAMTLIVPEQPAVYYPNRIQYKAALKKIFKNLPPPLLKKIKR